MEDKIGAEGPMVRACNEVQIEDLRHHPAETVRALRRILHDGAKVSSDPKRTGFYEVDDGACVYYIHVTPGTGKILLLATWSSEAALKAEHRAA